MSSLAKVALGVISAMCFSLALSIGAFPEQFSSDSYTVIKTISEGITPEWVLNPLGAWVLVYGVLGVLSVTAASLGHEILARLSLTLTSMAIGAWAIGFTLAAFQGDLTGPSGPIFTGALMGLCLVWGIDPMTTPFEPRKGKKGDRGDDS